MWEVMRNNTGLYTLLGEQKSKYPKIPQTHSNGERQLLNLFQRSQRVLIVCNHLLFERHKQAGLGLSVNQGKE